MVDEKPLFAETSVGFNENLRKAGSLSLLSKTIDLWQNACLASGASFAGCSTAISGIIVVPSAGLIELARYIRKVQEEIDKREQGTLTRQMERIPQNRIVNDYVKKSLCLQNLYRDIDDNALDFIIKNNIAKDFSVYFDLIIKEFPMAVDIKVEYENDPEFVSEEWLSFFIEFDNTASDELVSSQYEKFSKRRSREINSDKLHFFRVTF